MGIDRRNEAHLLNAKLETFINRRGYVRFRLNFVKIDPRNEAHLLYAKLETVITRRDYVRFR